jgi:tyrosinase
MATALVRRDIWSLEHEQPWHPITTAYALAIWAMDKRDPEDPTSWRYQAAVHATPPDVLPDKWRDQCQHNTWFFLPWHRLYLFWFERIVRKAMEEIDEISPDVKRTWALPYWNYSRKGDDYAQLPQAFRTETMANGEPNPLFVRERARWINAGDPLPDASISELAFREPVFTVTPRAGVATGFGGPKTGWHHLGEPPPYPPGALEITPHGSVHVDVGGPGGWMAGFDTAPLDPVFWLHHANIDRMWVAWLAQARVPSPANPDDPDWPRFPFDFHDEKGDPVKSTPAEALRTEDLGYTYEDATPPAAPPRRRAVTPTTPPPDEPAELAGATDAPVELTGRAERVAVPLATPERLVRRGGPDARPERVYLNLEAIAGDRNPGVSYAVYVNVPDDDGAGLDSYHVGTIGFFGIERAGDLDREHTGGHGLRYAFDITDVVETLRDEGRWDPSRVTVTFAPTRTEAAEGTEEPAAAVRVGRVSIYYQ